MIIVCLISLETEVSKFARIETRHHFHRLCLMLYILNMNIFSQVLDAYPSASRRLLPSRYELRGVGACFWESSIAW